MKTRKKRIKLSYIKIRLFFIKIRKIIISYKLRLTKNTKLNFLFNILLLKLIDSKILI